MKIRLHFFPLIALTAALALTSCNEYTRMQNSQNYDVKYELAKQYYFDGEYNRASIYLQEVIAMLKGTDKGEESLFLLGMASYNARNYDAAVAYLRKYYQSYPKGTYAEKARFMAGMALYKNTPEVKLDQTATFEAVTEFQNYLEVYPIGERSRQAQEMIFKLQDRLVEKELLSAQLYYNLGTYFGNCSNGGSNYQACIITAENAIKEYPYTTLREEFAYLILKAKFELAANSVDQRREERYHEAIDEYYGFTNEYPESKYIKEAGNLYKKARKYVGEETKTDEE